MGQASGGAADTRGIRRKGAAVEPLGRGTGKEGVILPGAGNSPPSRPAREGDVKMRDLTPSRHLPGIVGPGPGRSAGEGAAAGRDAFALADGIHAVIEAGNDARANLISLDVQRVAIRELGVGDGVDRAGDWWRRAIFLF